MIILVVAMVFSFLISQGITEKIYRDSRRNTPTVFSITNSEFRKREKKHLKLKALKRIMELITLLLGVAIIYLIVYMDQLKVFYVMAAAVFACAIWISIEIGVSNS